MMRLRLLALFFGIGTALAQTGESIVIAVLSLPTLPLGVVTLPGGKAINLSVAAGAGLFHDKDGPAQRVWSVSDRGPSMDCTTDLAEKSICPIGQRGRMFLLPGYSPAIYAMDISDKSGRFSEMVTLRGASGRPLSGLGLPQPGGREEAALSGDGQRLESDLSSIDPGGLVRLKNGDFIISDGYGPSLIEISRDGIVRRRLVAEDRAEAFRTADYPVETSLPAEVSRRTQGRVLTSLAISPDESFLFLALQFSQDPASNPLILKLERTTGKVVARWDYPLDPEDIVSPAASGVARHDTRLMEITALDANRLLVLETGRSHSRIYRVPLPEAMLAGASEPGERIMPTKSLVYAAERHSPLGRLSGMTLLSERELVLSGTGQAPEGGRTHLFRLTFARSLTN